MESLEDHVECLGTFWAVKEQSLLGMFDELRLLGLENARCSRILWFPVYLTTEVSDEKSFYLNVQREIGGVVITLL